VPLVPAVGTQLSPPPATARDQYRVQVFQMLGAVWGHRPGALLCEFGHPKNIGWGRYLNDVPEAFFTINQDDPQISLLRGYEGKAHVWIWRGDHLVWTGFFGLEVSATSQDAVFYCFGYEAAFYWLHTDWNQEWTNVSINLIVSELWSRARGLSNSNLAFVGTGIIESPVTTSGGSTTLTLPVYRVYHKRILFALQELAALAMSDTDNQVIFEITHAQSPNFNFFKGAGQVRSDLKMEWGGKYVRDFHYQTSPIHMRNFLYAVASDPHQLILRTDTGGYSGPLSPINGDRGSDGYGRREEALFFSWVRDQNELSRALNRRLSIAQQADTEIALDLFPNTLTPPGGRDAKFQLGDHLPIKIVRGITNINENRLIRGVRVIALQDGGEYVTLITQKRAMFQYGATGRNMPPYISGGGHGSNPPYPN